MRSLRACLIFAAFAVVAACGTKSGLTLPPKPQAATPPAGAKPSADNSSKPAAEAAP